MLKKHNARDKKITPLKLIITLLIPTPFYHSPLNEKNVFQQLNIYKIHEGCHSIRFLLLML